MEIGKKYKVSNKYKKSLKEITNYLYEDGKQASYTTTWRFGSFIIKLQNESEIEILDSFQKDEYFSSENFSDLQLDILDDLVDEEWSFENDADYEKFEALFEEEEDEFYGDFQDFLQEKIGFTVCERYFEIEHGGIKIEEG